LLGTVSLRASEIHDAAKENEIERIEILLEEDPALLNSLDENNMTPLNTAALNGHPELVKVLLEKGADISIGDMDNSQPIHCAAISGNIEVAELLLAHGADVNEKDYNGATPLTFATGRGHLEMIRYLVEQGADINAQNREGLTFLHIAVWRGRTDIVQTLLEQGANPNIGNEQGVTPLFWPNGDNCYEITRLLIENGARIDARNQGNSTPLHFIAGTGSVEATELLLSHGADINAISNFGWTPLCMAALCNAEITEYLITHGADVNPHELEQTEELPCQIEHQTPLHCAVRSDSVNTVQVLVDNGALINVSDEDGMTPLHAAVRNGNTEMVRYFLKSKAVLNTKDENFGRTEIHTAAVRGYKDIVTTLIQNGATIDVRDKEGKTPWDHAQYHGFTQTANLLSTEKIDRSTQVTPDEKTCLSTELGSEQAIIWHLGHSSWAIKTENHLLIFDYFANPHGAIPDEASLASGYVIPNKIKDENTTVFVSHHHGDHYDPRVFEWRNDISDIEYIFGFRPRDIEEAYTFIGPRTEKEVGDIQISTIKSNDAGVGFLIKVDGLTILHPGDHANGYMDMSGMYTAEIDALATEEIDLAFFAILGCSLGTPESVQLGVHYALEKLKPKVLFPMHAGNATYRYRAFVKEAAEKNYTTQLAYALNEGDRFIFKDGQIDRIE
jgi:ankyrin repeat protein/L-ascorbate metabolism protein UlaG (beta-lactamase superfamily)